MSLFKKLGVLLGARLRGDPLWDCGQAAEHLFDVLDQEADAATARRVRDHLQICPHCATRADFERAFLRAVESAAQAGEPIPEGLRDRISSMLDETERESSSR